MTTSRSRPSQSWTQDDDNMLREARSRGMNWFQIARTHFPSKSANACRKRHERLQEKEHADSYGSGPGLERLAYAYADCRARIWQPLAEQLGESDWRIVEKKAMELGLKNLQGAVRGHRSHPSPDSGIMMLDDTPYPTATPELWTDGAAAQSYGAYRPAPPHPQAPVSGAYDYRPQRPSHISLSYTQPSPAVGYAPSPTYGPRGVAGRVAGPVGQGQQTRAPTIGFITDAQGQSQAGSQMYGPPAGWARH